MKTHPLKAYSYLDLKSFIRKRDGEQKLGEVVAAADKDWEDTLRSSAAKFVIIGIAEDIGVRANHGRPGAHSAFRPALSSFLNQQHNHFLDAENILVLGEIMVDDLMEKAEKLPARSKTTFAVLRELVAEIDERVTYVISKVVGAGKIPIVIGGGHNNSFGNIRGSALAMGNKLNVINCDPHLDFRETEGRHSGNGFSYAYDAGHLQKYAVLCMHEQYNNKHVLERFRQAPKNLFYESFESVFIRQEKSFESALKNCTGFLGSDPCGVELDLDAISNVPSSARTSSGLSAFEARRYLHYCGSFLNCVYLHIAEAAPVLSHIRADIKTGKLIAYLITDFMKARSAKDDGNKEP